MQAEIRVLALALVAAGAVSSFFIRQIGLAKSRESPPLDTPQIFSPAHASVLDAVKEFVDWRAEPVQPIAFTHKKHAENQVVCTACHKGVNQGPDAGLPSARVCMRCHAFFGKDRPEIQKLTRMFNAGVDVSWQRVYGFSPTAHVKFNHSPHVRAGIDCSNCHGDVKNMTVAERAVKLSMGFCLQCHRSRQASTDCVTCHF